MLKYTDLKVAGRQNLLDILPLSKPFTVLIEPTSLCNFRCVQCFQSLEEENYFSRNIGHMPLERFGRVIQQLVDWPGPKLKVLKLSLYGEPMANRDFSEMLGIAAKSKVADRIEVTTNASLLTEKMAEHLVASQLDYLRVSIYATNQEAHEAVTGNKIGIDRIWNNLMTLKRVKERFNSQRPFVTCKKLDDFSSDNEYFLSQYSAVSDETFIDKPHGWVKADKIDFIKRYYSEGSKVALDDMRSRSSERTACPMPFTTMAVRSDGSVSPCCVDYAGGTNIGHVDASSLQSIWESQGWLDFQKMQLEGRQYENASCSSCEVYKDDHYTRDNIDGFPVNRLLGNITQVAARHPQES
jgi:radical SAM protein with 4Fe4S-binding SPASM domain